MKRKKLFSCMTAMVMLFSVFAYAGVPLASAIGESLRIMETEASSESEFDLLAELFDISISNNDDGFFTAKVGGTEATQANEGDTVTIEANLPDGSVLNGISVDKSGTAVEVTKLTDTSYSFEMPSSNVTVTPDVTLPYKITFENSESDFEISDGKYHQANDTVTLTTTFTTMKYVKNLVGTYVSGSSTRTISLENGITVGDGGTANDIKQYTYTFTMPKSDLILSADMITLPKIEVDSDYDGDGNITISPVDEDTEVVFANTPMKISLNETFIDGEDTYVLYDLQVVPTDSTITPLFLGLGMTKEADGDYRFNAPESDAKVKAFYYKLSSGASSENVVAVVEQNDVRTGYTSLKTAIESGVTADGNEAIIIVIADSTEDVMTVSANKNIRLVNNGSDKTVKRAAAGQGDFITVASGAVLTLGGEGSQSNIIIDGGAKWTKIDEKVDPRRDPSTEANWQGTAYSDTPTKVLFQDGDSWEDCYWFTRGGFTATGSLINNSGTLNLYDGAKLTNNFNATQDNRGGAIYNSSTINMYGGEISWCTARRSNQGTGAGIYSASGTTINMYGGAIKNNTNIDVGATYSSGNNRSGDGAGIAIDSGVLNMYGGEISQNHGSSDTSGGDGGGIIAREGAKIYLRGGKISANYTAGYGGGILLYLSYLYIYDGEISNNYSGYGGAVGMSQGYVTMFGGSISGNAAKYGGGVCIGSYNYNTGCSFDMYGGSIVSNTADYGGGICNYNGGGNYANLRGGKISDNTATTGKGVAIVNMSQSSDSKTDPLLYLSGDISINTNNDVYFDKSGDSNNYINYSGATQQQIPIRVTDTLTSTGTVALIGFASGFWEDTNQAQNGEQIVSFERTDGSQLTVQSNKFALDNEAWILQTDGQHLDLANKEDSTVTRYIARVGDTLYKKLIDAVNAADSGDTVYIINNYTLEKTIEIDKDITIMSETNATKNASNVSDGSFKDSDGKTLSDFTYYPEGDYTLTLISDFADTEGNTSGFIVKDGATLNIGDPSVTESTVSTTNGGYLALDGNRAYATDGAMVSVEDGTLYINAGVTAENNNNTSGNGYGGAIYVDEGAEAVLNGGALYANRANYGGAVYADGTFRMISGVINEHTNGESDGAIYVSSNGCAVLTGGEIEQNGSYAVYQNGTLEMGGGIFIDSANAIYLPEEKIITVIEALDGENDTDNPISIYVEEEGADGIDVIETSIQGDVDSDKTEAEYILLDKRFAVTDGRKLSRSAESGKENYIVIKEINVTYDANGGTGSVPEDTEAYDGGDLIDIKPVTDDLARPGMMFIGWSTQKIDSVRSFTEEGSVQIYYNTEYSDDIYSAISYSDILYAYSDVTLYAVWALDTNINDIPDYRENVFNITVNTAEHGSMSASADTLQAGDMLLLTANPDTGYVMSDVTVEFYIDGEQNIWTLSSGDIQQISDTYLWLNMPKADITVTPEFEERVEEIAEVTWSDENTTIYPSLRAAVNGVAEIQSNGDVTAVQIKMLADHTVGGSGAMADVTITEDMEFVLDLNGCTINFGDYNMNNQGTVTVKDNSVKQTGKMIFGEDIEAASTSAGILENNGLLTVESGAIIGNNQDMLIYNKRMLDVTGGEIRNTYGSAIFNLDGEEDGANVDPNMGNSWSTTRGGVLEIEAGRVIGGSNGYGVYQDNDVMYSVNVKELGEPENYGEDKENYISSIRLSQRNASVNVSGFLENCNSDEVPVKILLSICDEAQAGDLILTTNVTNQDKTLRHYREHFTLSDDSMFIAVSDNEENKARLKKRVDSVKLDIPFDRNTFIYNDTLIVLTYMLDADGEVVTDATGTVYYFTADENTVWDEIWDDENKAFKEKDDGSGEYYSFSDAIAYQEVADGIVERTVVNKHYEAGAHFLAAIYVGDDYYDKYSYGAERNGYETPLASNMQEFEVVQKPLTQSMLDADDITKPYTGQNYASWLPVNVSLTDSYSLSLNTDYYIQLAVYNYTIQDAGEYDITIHGIGNYSGTVDLKFTVEQYTDALNVSLSQEYYLSAPDIVFEGSGATASVTDIYGNTLSTDDFTYKFYTLDENGDIDEDIEPSTEAPSEVGMYRMVVNGSGGNYSEVAEGGVNFVIIKTDGALSVETDDGEFVYNGYDKYVDVESVPEGTADENVRSLDVYGTVDDEPIKLTYGSHYLVSWGGSIRPNSAGNYTLLIIGTDMFAGDYSAKIMSVSKYELDENNTSVIFTDGDGAETSEFEYDGTAHYANVKIDGGVPDGVNLLSRFEQDKDYLVSYSGKKLTTDESSGSAVLDESQYINVTRDENDNVIAGSEVEISGTGVNYSGSFTKKYTIVPRDMEKYSDEITASVTDISFSGAANEPVIIVEDNCSTIQDKHLEEGTDFEVTYEAADDDASLITVNGKDYPYSSGNYKAIISGIGNYSGTITQEFSMTGYSGGIIVSLSPSVYGYTGQAVQLVTLSVTNDNGIALEEGVDYTLSYSLRSDPDTSVSAIEVGEYYVNVTGIGNYAGHSGRAEFDIISTSGLVSIVLKDGNSFIYTGEAIKPEIDLEKSLAGTDSLSTLTEGTDYYISYNATDPINVGTYPVTIRGIGEYAGYLGTVTYTITAKDINNEDNSAHPELETVNTEIINEDSLIYYSLGGVTLTTSGDDKTLSIEYNGNTLTEGTDFDITYSDNTSVVYSGNEIVKNATAKITGTGNYSGETVVTYAVLPKSIAEGTHGIVFNSSYSAYYTGLPVSVDFFEATDNGVYIRQGEDNDFTVEYFSDEQCTTSVKPMQVGTYYIKVTGIGNYIGSRVIPFVVSAQDDALSISVEPNVYQYTGSPIEPQNITVKYDSIVISEGYELEYYYDAQCTNPIDIENDGYPTVTGTYYIKAVGTGAHQNCTPGIASYTITGTPITKDGITVTLDERSFTYTGEGIKPSVTIMDGDTLLTEGVDYRLVYTNNINVGEGTITIYGIGGYIESRDETFVIGQSSDANAEVIGEYSYTGSEITAAVIVKNSSGAMLINGRDYTVEYSDNVNAGTASAVVSGTGNYSFTSDTLSYTIEKYTNKLFVSADNIHYTFDNESHTPQLTVTDIYGNTLTSEDYTVKYYTDSACVNEAEETVKTGVYYVKVNGTGVNYDSKASGVTAYMIIPSDHILTVTPSADDKVYNGSAYTAADFISEVAGESSVLTEADYDLYFADDASSVTDAASYVIIVLGKGNYDGFAGIVAVSVQPKDIASDDVVIDSLHSLTYTGGELKPDISINDSIGQLLQSRDYALDYADNIEIGTAKITVSGIGNYTGSREVGFDITSNTVNSMSAVLSGEYVYNGQPHEPKPTVTSNGTELTEGVDYVLTYKNNTNAGVASVTVTGIGDYAGTEIPISFYISARDIAEVTAELTSDAIYTGDTVTPVIKLTFDGTELIEGVDYIASYSNNVNAGVANVTVVGMGNYKNLKTNLTFNITESTEANVPSAPQVSLEAAKKSISVTWTAPDDNGSPITGYTIYYMEKGSDEVNSISVSAETNSYVIEGTKSNTSYTVWMTAENAVGEGEESSRNTVSASVTSSGGGGGSTTKVVVATAEPSSSGGSVVTVTPEPEETEHIAYISGYPDDTFGPELNMTRGEAAAIFARLSDYDDSHIYETSFSDISEGEWYENYIGFIEQFGMIEGYEDGTFRADNHITRAEFAAIIFRYTRLVDVQTTVFEDTESHWARSIISAIAEQGWLEGYEDGTFRPEQDITRAEAVTIINRALDRNADTEYIDDNSENLIIFKDMETSHWAYYDVAEATNAHRYMTEDGIENWIYDTIQ